MFNEPSSHACIEAPLASSSSTTSRRPYPVEKECVRGKKIMRFGMYFFDFRRIEHWLLWVAYGDVYLSEAWEHRCSTCHTERNNQQKIENVSLQMVRVYFVDILGQACI